MPSVTSDVFRVSTFFLLLSMKESNATTSQFLALPAVPRHAAAVAALYSALVKRPIQSTDESVVLTSIGIVAITLLPASFCACVLLSSGTNDQVARSFPSMTLVLLVGQPAS